MEINSKYQYFCDRYITLDLFLYIKLILKEQNVYKFIQDYIHILNTFM